jgi:nitroreductase
MYKLMGVGWKDRAARMEAMLSNYRFFGAPVGLFITVDRIVDRNGWGHVGMFIQNICLLATAYGLATCLQEAWANYAQVVTSFLGVPSSEVLWCGIALGYADPQEPINTLRTERRPLSEFVQYFGPAAAKL